MKADERTATAVMAVLDALSEVYVTRDLVHAHYSLAPADETTG